MNKLEVLIETICQDIHQAVGRKPRIVLLTPMQGQHLACISYPSEQLSYAEMAQQYLQDNGYEIVSDASITGVLSTVVFTVGPTNEPFNIEDERSEAIRAAAGGWHQMVGGDMPPHLTVIGHGENGGIILATGYGGNNAEPELERLIAIEIIARENGFIILKPAAIVSANASLLIYQLT